VACPRSDVGAATTHALAAGTRGQASDHEHLRSEAYRLRRRAGCPPRPAGPAAAHEVRTRRASTPAPATAVQSGPRNRRAAHRSGGRASVRGRRRPLGPDPRVDAGEAALLLQCATSDTVSTGESAVCRRVQRWRDNRDEHGRRLKAPHTTKGTLNDHSDHRDHRAYHRRHRPAAAPSLRRAERRAASRSSRAGIAGMPRAAPLSL
jgi:hypothetical protein